MLAIIKNRLKKHILTLLGKAFDIFASQNSFYSEPPLPGQLSISFILSCYCFIFRKLYNLS